MSDERDSAGSAGAGTDAGTDAGESESQGQTAVVTRPARPTGKRARRAVEVDESESDTAEANSDAEDSAADAGKKAKPKKAEKSKKTGPTRNPFVFVWNFLKQVVAELRKVIWPNRKQMIGYTTVVLVFLVFMVALIGGVDFGLAKLVMWVFG